MSTVTKVVENRLRRVAKRQGYTLRRARIKDPRATNYGRYRLEGHPSFDDPEFWATPATIAWALQESLEGIGAS
jgi:hypothetical protein